MGYMRDGIWHEGWYRPDEAGRFVRPPSRFHGRVTADGASGHPAEAERYHLYVSYACPWANRTLISRHLKGLEDAISVSVVDPRMGAEGWVFGGYHHPSFPGATPDHVSDRPRLQDIYREAEPRYTGRCTVPVLWDKSKSTIVSNESREIMRMLSLEFGALAGNPFDACPEDLRPAIDEALDAIYEPINNGVYRAGFATGQSAYEEACSGLFEALDHWDGVLGRQRYLCGDRLSEADVAMYTTLARFDTVYYSHFKCNLRRIADFPNLSGYLRDLYQTPGFAETTRLDHIKVHYYWSQENVNPTRIVPLGPTVDLTSPHDRDRLGPHPQPTPGVRNW